MGVKKRNCIKKNTIPTGKLNQSLPYYNVVPLQHKNKPLGINHQMAVAKNSISFLPGPSKRKIYLGMSWAVWYVFHNNSVPSISRSPINLLY